jgi:hypothetical protein
MSNTLTMKSLQEAVELMSIDRRLSYHVVPVYEELYQELKDSLTKSDDGYYDFKERSLMDGIPVRILRLQDSASNAKLLSNQILI